MTAGFVILAIIGVLWFLGWLIRMRRARSVAANRPTVLKEALERARQKQREPPVGTREPPERE